VFQHTHTKISIWINKYNKVNYACLAKSYFQDINSIAIYQLTETPDNVEDDLSKCYNCSSIIKDWPIDKIKNLDMLV
jgi:hypothetical protein